MDVKNSFLNGSLTEEVYMHPSSSLLHSSGKVFILDVLCMAKHVNEVIHCAGFTDTKVSDTPIELNVKLNSTDGVPLDDPMFYRELVGCLVYLTVTRHDLAYAVHVVSQFVFAPCSTHWATLVRILRYLRGTIFQDLLLSSTSSLDLVAYVDFDWAGDVNDRKSTSRFCMFLGDSLIYWKSKKQTVVARSTAETEYRAMAHATAELVGLRCLLSDLGVPRHYAINACLAPLYSVEGMHVITLEGVRNRKYGLHQVQESLAVSHGSQCGFCTSGFIMSMYALLRSSQTPPPEEQIEESLAGNLCRCTGYRPIVDAFQVFAKTNDMLYTNASLSSTPRGEFVCPSTGKPCSCGSETVCRDDTNEQKTACGERYEPISYSEIDGKTYTNKELIFPSELLLRKLTYLSLNGSGGLKWYRPLRLQHVLDLKSRYLDAKLVIGNTEIGIEMWLKGIQYQFLVCVACVPELNKLSVKNDGLEIGAEVRLSELLKVFRKANKERADHETSSCKAFIEQIKWFAGTQIKNVVSVGGNIYTASPISNLNPLWMAGGAKFQIIDCQGNIRTVAVENFFLGYRKVDLSGTEILLSIFLPWTRPFKFVKEFEQAHRRDDDIAIVNAGIPTWNNELLQGVLKVRERDILIKEDAPGRMVSHQMEGKSSFTESVSLSRLSAVQSFHRPSVIGSQNYDIIKQGIAVGSPEVHLSARLQFGSVVLFGYKSKNYQISVIRTGYESGFAYVCLVLSPCGPRPVIPGFGV
ncbi:hypothetical protein HYC85_004060 [Camellia sinensis]|uniref:xanthine dehydrogenase n=1 Tax=Camellia sinensis TaxID=4442 RepID=A0A7J7HWE9_CAMSI|nr:hypothetical protein HYC85_004060 [Camellia sinensis]